MTRRATAHPPEATQAAQALLAEHGLPQRWQGRAVFVLLSNRFGLGHGFLAAWAAWRADPQRPTRLHWVAVDAQAPHRDELAQAWTTPSDWDLGAHTSPGPGPDSTTGGTAEAIPDPLLAELARSLVAHWPPATPDSHLIDLDGGQVRLLLIRSGLAQALPDLVAQVDAFCLQTTADLGPPAAWDRRLLQGLNRLAAPGATAPALAPLASHRPPAPPGRQGQPGLRQVVVVGAGLAGAAAAQALARQGLQVQVLEALPGPAQATSGNPGGLLHGIVHAQDGPHARWLRMAALHAQRALAPLVADGRVGGQLKGLLRGESALAAAQMQALLDQQALPADYVQVQLQGQMQVPAPVQAASTVERIDASGPVGAAAAPAWLYPEAGWVAPADLVAHWLRTPGITLRTHCSVKSLVRHGTRWRLLNDLGQTLAEADAVVLANAHEALHLLAPLGLTAWPTGRQRGQTTVLPAAMPGAPALPLPLAAGGYALRLPDGRLLCGATSQPGDLDPALRAADHADNLAKLARLTGWAAPLAPQDPRLGGRVGWRFVTDDRLPLVGPVPVAQPQGPRLEQPRQVPRMPGLWLLAALGSRGITQAALAGELLAAWMTEAPWPVPASLADALDPARFVARAARQKASQAARTASGSQATAAAAAATKAAAATEAAPAAPAAAAAGPGPLSRS